MTTRWVAAAAAWLLACGAPTQIAPVDPPQIAVASPAPVEAPVDASVELDAAVPAPENAPVVVIGEGISINGARISTESLGDATWRVSISSTSPRDIIVAWSNSTFVTTNKVALGALERVDGVGVEVLRPWATMSSIVRATGVIGMESERAKAITRGGRLALALWVDGESETWVSSAPQWWEKPDPARPEGDLKSKLPSTELPVVPGEGRPRAELKPPRVRPSLENPIPPPEAADSPTFRTFSGPSCKRGCPCGNSCISCSKTCRGGSTSRRRRR